MDCIIWNAARISLRSDSTADVRQVHSPGTASSVLKTSLPEDLEFIPLETMAIAKSKEKLITVCSACLLARHQLLRESQQQRNGPIVAFEADSVAP
jgi:hypothetical protein